jgi:ferredoxin
VTAGPEGVEVLVDRDTCLSSQTCVRALPEAFAIDDEGVASVLPTVVGVSVDELLEAARECPVGAIDVLKGGESLLDLH